MPIWKIHQRVATILSKKLNINKKYFLIGNLLPDQDKYNIPNFKRNINQESI